jgi:hypothetical protein
LTMEFWLSGSLSHKLFFFHDGILAIKKPFSRTFLFSRWNSVNTQFGGRLFSYIYHKEYLHRIRLVKNLPSWFRAPFARKRVRSFLFFESKDWCFFPKSLDSDFLIFQNTNLRKWKKIL